MTFTEQMDYLYKCAEQRAFLMGMLRTIFNEQNPDLYGGETRQLCFKTLLAMMKYESMVKDEIDLDILKTARTACQQEVFLDEVNQIINEFD